MKNTFVSNSIWWIAALAVVLALIAANVDAHAQDDPTPTATATETPTATVTEDELITCWWEGDTYICMSPPVAVTSTPSATPTATTAPQFAANYLPLIARNVFITPRAEVSGDVR